MLWNQNEQRKSMKNFFKLSGRLLFVDGDWRAATARLLRCGSIRCSMSGVVWGRGLGGRASVKVKDRVMRGDG